MQLFKDFGLYSVDLNYLSYLYSNDSEVMYSSDNNYEDKPFLGTLITISDIKYLIPLTSAKNKHIGKKDIDDKQIRIFEIIDTRFEIISPKDIIDTLTDSDIEKLKESGIEANDTIFYKKKLLSVLMIGKMIPVSDLVIMPKDLKIKSNMDTNEYNKRVLLNKEYLICLSLKDKIFNKAAKLYEKSMSREKPLPFCCDFKKLEECMRDYN